MKDERPQPPAPPDAPDNVRYVTFGQQSDLPSDHALARCRHCSYKINAEQRVIRCGECSAELDPFVVMLEYARGERNWRHWDAESRAKRTEIAALAQEERLTKARLRNVRRKDASLAVAEERSRIGKELAQLREMGRELAQLSARLERIGRRSS